MKSETPPLIRVIDDDASLRIAISRLLCASGFRVAAFDSAEHFLQSASLPDPGCILLDNNMPGLSGEQLHHHLTMQHCPLPVIYLTGKGSIAMGVRAIKAGAEDFLAKPVAKSDLLAAIERAMVRYEKTKAHHIQLQDWRSRMALLTERELEVFMLAVQGLLNKQIAYELGNTERTVKAQRHSITEKLQMKSVTEWVSMALQLELLKVKDG